MEKIFLSTATSYFIALVLVPVSIKIFKAIDLLDDPDDRKLHKEKTPSMGGIPIFMAVFIALPIWLPFSALASGKYLLASCILIFLLGVRDDFEALRARHKLIAQLVIGGIVIYFADIRFMSLYGIFGIYDLPFWASALITMFTFVVITNSFNLIDGIDGLAGTIGIVILGFLGFWFFQMGNQTVSFLCFSTVGAMMAFLYFNWQPARIFMGDTGSMFIGFTIAVLVVKFIDLNYALPQASNIKLPGHISMAVGLLSVPLFDTLRVFILRTSKGRSPMVPDRNHIHHRLLDIGLSHRQATLTLLSVNVIFTLAALWMQPLGNMTSLAILISTACIMNFVLFKMHQRSLVTTNSTSQGHKESKQIYLSKSA